MHIPDGVMDGRTAVATMALSAAGLSLALRHTRLHLPPQRVPLMGLAGAFVFSAQMLNFPVVGGASGHLVGSVLTAVLLGPSAAVVVISAVLIVQCLMFNDGGVTALGANVFNMAIISAAGGYAVYDGVGRVFRGRRGQVLAASFAAWCGTVLGAVACAGEIAMSGATTWSKVLPAMAGVHMFIGVGEGVLTGIVLVAIGQLRPELLPDRDTAGSSRRYAVLAAYGLLISLGFALFVAPVASQSPDALERIVGAQGFATAFTGRPALAAPIPDYRMPGLGSATTATSVAGAIGTVVVFCVSLVLARVLVPGVRRRGARVVSPLD
jgi:cobalt/nickel transport system permease protein